MKKKLLSYIIRECVEEVLDFVEEKEEGDTEGAPSPPAGGQGTADTPPIDKSESPSSLEQDTLTSPVPTTGIHFIHPKDKGKFEKMTFKDSDDAQLERQLFNMASKRGGTHVKVSLSTQNAVKNNLRTKSVEPLFLYFGKYDPESDEVFLMSDKDVNKAKQNSVEPTDVISPLARSSFDPMTASDKDMASRVQFGGRTPPVRDIDERTKSLFKEAIRKALFELHVGK